MQKLAILGGRPTVQTPHTVAWPVLTNEIEQHVLCALRNEQLGYGKHSVTRTFEEEFAEFHGRKYAIATNSGTSALLLAYFACGLFSDQRSGTYDSAVSTSEVIVPGYGFFATVSPLLYLGITPIFCDAMLDTCNLDVDRLQELISPRTRAVVVTHVDGHPAEISAIRAVCRCNNLTLIEDCSHAHGAMYRGQIVGTFGQVSAFSFQTGKMVSGGEGGMLLTDDQEVFKRALAFANFRRAEGVSLELPSWLSETGLGLKLRMSPLSAAMAQYFLRNLDQFIDARRQSLDYLTELLRDSDGHAVSPPITHPYVTRGAYYEYRVRYHLESTDQLPLEVFRIALQAEGMILPHSNTRAVYKLPLLRMSLREAIYQLFQGANEVQLPPQEALPNADCLEAQTFTLPTFTGEPSSLIREYATGLSKVYAQRKSLFKDYRANPAKYGYVRAQ